jgi:hypothetical protein
MIRPAGLVLALALLAALPADADAAETVLRAQRPRSAPVYVHAEARNGSWHVRVLDTGGVERQRFEVPTDAPDSPPRLVDADEDGAADLWLPLITGNANSTFDLWRMEPARTRFARAGEISGSFFTLDPAGYLVATGRNGCCATEHLFHRFDQDGELALAFTLTRRLDPDLPAAERCLAEPGAAKPPTELVERLCALDAEAPMPGRRLPVH